MCACGDGALENPIVVGVADDGEPRRSGVDDACREAAQGVDEPGCRPAKRALGEDASDLFENRFRREELDAAGYGLVSATTPGRIQGHRPVMTQLIDDGLHLLLARDAHLLGTFASIGQGTSQRRLPFGMVQIEPEGRAYELGDGLMLPLGKLLDGRLKGR